MNTRLDPVGYVEDEEDYADYKENLEDFVDLLSAEKCTTLDEILEWIFKNKIECLIVDHKLTNKYSFLGTDVVSFINKNIPDLPCLILTSFKTDSMSENLVIDSLIKDKEELLKGDNLKIFGEELKQACGVYRNRIRKRKEEFKGLYEKKNKQDISVEEEEELRQAYKILNSSGEIDDIPSEMFTSEMSKKVDILLKKLDNCISSCKDENNEQS